MTATEPPTEALIPPLIEPYPALASLYRAVVENPTQDEPRLQFADACLEAADEGAPDAVRAWAEFIQLQFARHKMGTPRRLFADIDIVQAGGPDYYQMPAFEHQAVLVVGERVDVKPHKSQVALRKVSSTKTLHGLKVVRVEASGWDGQWTVTLKRDEDSVPFPKKAYEAALAAEDRALFVGLLKWVFDPLPKGCPAAMSHDIYLPKEHAMTISGRWHQMLWEKGFVSRLEVNALRPDALAWLVRMFPVHIVKAKDPPPIVCDAHKQTCRFETGPSGEISPAFMRQSCVPRDGSPRVWVDRWPGLWEEGADYRFDPSPPVVELLRTHFPRVATWEIQGHTYGQNRPS